MSDTLNRLHDLRVLSQDLRRAVEKERAWQVATHLSACENEITEAIAFVNLCDEAKAQPETHDVFTCQECAVEYNKAPSVCGVCGSRLVVKSPAIITLPANQNRS